ncbi:ABC transporter permease [Brevundimonas variabilis]|uniref:Capsular polysaccharide transport system permease protein n=1 Tax=Brevundimonas variabilis TaxID=74312 RepID=A0A7W9CGS0_9CAUL|nr:ABC transporter permease [Brevundimonas variabilis]MBB5745340.1 capsular polysaccharide transport system permease protein [Brevundimonas variabilis]
MTDAPIFRHARIINALVMREMNTRFGREGIGFVWLIAEPLAFCFGILTLWILTKPAYEHGVRIAPFVMTGYMSIILCRHFISQAAAALQANMGLMHHRQISPTHIYVARAFLEFLGATAAFIVVYVVLLALGQVELPKDILLVYGGWLLLAWIAQGFALIIAGLSMRFEAMERIVPLLSYLLIPFSGAFTMVSWLPEEFRKIFLYIPFPHAIEMLRAGVFGEFVKTYYDPGYAFLVGSVMIALGLLLISISRNRIDVE